MQPCEHETSFNKKKKGFADFKKERTGLNGLRLINQFESTRL